MIEGIIYCLRYPQCLHLVKIGKTSADTVEARGLNISNIPEDFETVFAYKVHDIDALEKFVHSVLDDEFRYKSKSGRSTEFFYTCAAEKAKKHVLPFALDDKTLETELEVDDNPIDVPNCIYRDDDLVSWDDLRRSLPADSCFGTETRGSFTWA